MKKNTNKMISHFLTFLMLFSFMGNVVFATAVSDDISGSVGRIVNAVAFLGHAIAFGMLAFVGIKYVLSPANENADVKQGSINYLIGAFFIFCASGVANLIVGIATSSGDAGGLAGEIINAAQGVAGS